MHVLNQLYKGKLMPLEMYRSLTEAYEKKREEIAEQEDDFIEKLRDDDLRRMFIRLLDERTGLIPEDCEQLYIQGMCMGACLALELTGWRQEMPEK